MSVRTLNNGSDVEWTPKEWVRDWIGWDRVREHGVPSRTNNVLHIQHYNNKHSIFKLIY